MHSASAVSGGIRGYTAYTHFLEQGILSRKTYMHLVPLKISEKLIVLVQYFVYRK